MEEQKLVLQEGTYKYDDRTNQVSVSEDELRKAGYVKLADDEQVVKKVELIEDEAKFMEEYKRLVFWHPQNCDFYCEATDFADRCAETFEDVSGTYKRLAKAYFNGYTVKEEPRYYIKFPLWDAAKLDKTYLNVLEAGNGWELHNKIQHSGVKTQFTQSEINSMRQDERAQGLDLNALKVRVPNDELKD